MKVRLLDGRTADVVGRECATRACLRVGHYVHRSAAGASARADDRLSCVRWQEQGCPPREERRLADESSFHAADCPRPCYGSRILSPHGNVRCLGCRRLVPRAVVLVAREHGR